MYYLCLALVRMDADTFFLTSAFQTHKCLNYTTYRHMHCCNTDFFEKNYAPGEMGHNLQRLILQADWAGR